MRLGAFRIEAARLAPVVDDREPEAASNSTTIGMAIAHIVNGSVVGVAIAANRKIRKIATRCDFSGASPEHTGEIGHHDEQRELERAPEDDEHEGDERDVVVDRQQRAVPAPEISRTTRRPL